MSSSDTGRVIAVYDIIMDTNGEAVNFTQLNSALSTVILSGLPGMEVDITYSPTVAG